MRLEGFGVGRIAFGPVRDGKNEPAAARPLLVEVALAKLAKAGEDLAAALREQLGPDHRDDGCQGCVALAAWRALRGRGRP